MTHIRRFLVKLITPMVVVAVAVGMSLTLAVPAFASATGTVITPSGERLHVRSGPGTSYNEIGALTRGTVVSFSCYATGTAVTGPYGTETAWDRLDSGGYVSDAWIYTGSNNAVVPQCGPNAGCYAKSCVGKNPGTEGCTDAQMVRQYKLWEPGGRDTAVVWEYHSNLCDAAWFEAIPAVEREAGDSAKLSAWNPGGPSQHFSYSVDNHGNGSGTYSAMVDDENGVQACTGAQIYYLRAVTVNGEVTLVKTYYMWKFLGCR